MSARRKAGGEADRLWQQLVTLVMDSRGDWRRQVIELTGLPFSRVRALRRLLDAPLTLVDLAYAMSTDAPAATVAVNDLERRGLVERYPHPENRRAKLVALTPAGKQMVARVHAISEHAPDALAALSAADLAQLRRILDAIHSA
ncbi:MAG: MarR family winged helix-turn-helix transcriptional regulator [Nevskiales bacterium]